MLLAFTGAGRGRGSDTFSVNDRTMCRLSVIEIDEIRACRALLNISASPLSKPFPRLLPMKPILAACLSLITLLVYAQTISNSLYTLTLNPDHTVSVNVGGIPTQTLSPEFTVMFSQHDPLIEENHDNYMLAPRSSMLWRRVKEDAATLQSYLNSSAVQADLGSTVEITDDASGRTWRWLRNISNPSDDIVINPLTAGGAANRYSGGTINPFAASAVDGFYKYVMTPSGASLSGDTITWSFSAGSRGTLTAELALPTGAEDPLITYEFTATEAGWFSVVFTGAPTVAASSARRIDQDTATRGFQLFNHVVAESSLHMPHVYIGTTSGWTTALMMDPVSVPWVDADTGLPRIPLKFASYFGAMLQKDYTANTFKPLLFAPMMGGLKSQLAVSEKSGATIRYILRNSDWKDVFSEQAQVAYGNGDVRDNSGTGSINQTIDRLMDFLGDANGNNFAMWHAEQKYYDYANDAPGSFKPFSPLFGLSLAIVTDDENFYRTRARAQVEFALSRHKNLFAPYDLESDSLISDDDRSLAPGTTMAAKLPYLGYAQSTTLHHFLQGRNYAPLFYRSANASSFPEMLAKYSVTGDSADLDAAMTIADADITNDPLSSAYRYMDWFDLWEASGATPASRETSYLSKTRERTYAEVMSTITLAPAIPPPSATITLDEGGRAPLHVQSAGRHVKWGFAAPQGYPTPEQTVPAWRSSLNGLEGQAPYRGSYFANRQPQFMRVGSVSDDPFLANVGRLAFVGRFGNYAGDFRAAPSLVAERPELAENPLWKMTHSTYNPGHAWEFAAAVFDFLVSDVYYRSLEAVDFPARTMFGGGEAQFRVRLYGDRPGKFYGDTDVRLWMPKGLIQTNNPQVDYVSGYGNGKLYVVFLNRSAAAQNIDAFINPDLADIEGTHSAQIWVDNVAQSSSSVSGNEISFSVPAKGIVAYAINDVTVSRGLHQKMLSSSAPILGASSMNQTELTVTGYPTATVTGMLLSLGQGLTHAYIYSDAHAIDSVTKQLLTRSARLTYRQGSGAWQELTDAIYPFEFSVDFAEGQGDLEYKYYLTAADGTESGWSSSVVLSAGSLPAQAPQSPSDLSAKSDEGKVHLKWTGSTGASTYNIKRATTSGGVYSTVATGVTANAYADTTVTNGTTYYYVVTAVNSTGESVISRQVYVTPNPVPTGFIATVIGNGSVHFSWTPIAGATGYVIKRTDAGNGSYEGVYSTVGSATGTSYVDVPPTNDGSTYHYVVAAVFGASGEGGTSVALSAMAEPISIILDDADSVGVTITGTSWTHSSSSQAYKGAHRYTSGTASGRSVRFTPTIPAAGVYKVLGWWSAATARADNAVYEIVSDAGLQTVSVNQRLNGGQWRDLGNYTFSAGTLGSVTVRTDPSATGSISADAFRFIYVEAPYGPVPNVPTGLGTFAADSQVTLSWSAAAGAASYTVKRSTTGGGPYSVVGLSIPGTSFTDTTVTNGIMYYYVITGDNASGSSAESSEVSAMPIITTTVSFTSIASEDGWVQESSETSNVGSVIDSTASSNSAIKIGDNAVRKQWKGIVSFDTSSLPDGATIISAELKLKRGNLYGSVAALGSLYADIMTGGFNGNTALETGDFQATATATQVAEMSIPAANNLWSTGSLNASGQAAVNKTGKTQFRVYFSVDDNDNSTEDYISFFSGDNATAANHPVLEIIYTTL
jgi:fibronectin type 3 domain-containing protein